MHNEKRDHLMKKWQKFFLGLLCLIYIFVLSMTIWPQSITAINDFVANIAGNSPINQHALLNVSQLVLLVLTILILLVIIFIPAQKNGILLEKNKQGVLSLSNDGVTSFVNTILSGYGLSNIRVAFKNTKHVNQFDITADSVYQRHVIKQLPQIKQTLTSDIQELLSGIDEKKLKLSIKVDQKSTGSSRKKRSTRVV
ncbi:alkaline shock response membrane anchor protein AmaP [Leuconostoc rapi]|uniref:alkaline shock response membrane anchor protein AmaP n=2 Tax=Leuconostoc rapi TaxID=1406906 RepID=UPI0027E58A79|nr:alkaline shock response membrane anchor protein AmaP [Leuconostoc rapi]